MPPDLAPGGAEPVDAQLKVIERLRAAIQRRDPAAAESALNDAYGVGLHQAMSAAMIELVESPWHTRHEDAVHALQQLRSPDAIDALERLATTEHDYLGYDEFKGLARKCIWALADIGKPAARAALTRLAESPDSQASAYARRRLARWDVELGRKLT
ncbi:MAG: hypothetical protein KDB08_11125 [Microthrixaceae bacterium]|nr:hypothetical protein [Microthrixaceae bacterium]